MADDVLAYVLDGLEKALELERELGVRSVEFDRSLLIVPAAPEKVASPVPTAVPVPAPAKAAPRPAMPAPPPQPIPGPAAPVRPAVAERPSASSASYDFVFMHDRPLSDRGREMMVKIVQAMGRDPATAPVVVEPPIPKAKIYVFLGLASIRRYMPNLRVSENQWTVSPKGKPVLLVRSPEEILRYRTVTPTVKKLKQDMWLALKSILQRLELE